MKALLVAAVLLAGATAANAEEYPPCSSSVTDKCSQHGGHHMKMMGHHGKMHRKGHHRMHHKMHGKHHAMHHKAKAKSADTDAMGGDKK